MNEKLTVVDIKEIIDLVRADSNIEWFVFKQGDVEISLSRNGIPAQLGPIAGPPAVSAPAPQPNAPAPAEPAKPHPQPQPQPEPTSGASDSLAPGEVEIKAPMVGTFYRRPKPGADPFVEEGTVVEPGDTICIVEVMKLMNSVRSETSGTIKRILVEDGQPVEYGQVLMVVGGDQ